MRHIIQGYLIILLEIVCCRIFFDTFMQNKFLHGYRRWGILMILSIIDLLFVLLFSDFFFLKQICIILATSAVMKIYTGKSLKEVFALTLIFQGLLIVADYVVVGFQSVFLKGTNISSGYAGILMLILAKAILFFIVVLIKSIFSGKEFSILQDTDWIRFMFFPLFTICVITAMLSEKSYSLIYQYDIFFIIIAIGLIGMNIFAFYLLNDIILREKELRENRMLELEARNKLKLYETLSESIDKQRMLSHEYHSQINIIQGLCESGQLDELKKEGKDINGTFLCEINRFETHNAIINTILNEKYQEALNNGILFVCKINDMGSLKVSSRDIALMLSNLLNNAIEACIKCSGEKIIKIKMLNLESKFILSVKNTYCGEIRKGAGQFLTTKADNENHGFGLKNVINAVKRNGGEYVIKAQNEEFFISINIPDKN